MICQNKNEKLIVFSIVVLLVFVVGFSYIDNTGTKTKCRLHVEAGNNNIYLIEYGITLRSWERDGVTFFFLPSYADITSIEQDDINSTGKVYCKDGTLLSSPMLGEIQDIFVDFGDGERIPWKIAFFRSSNIYTAHINLEDAEADDIEHELYIPAELLLYSPQGRLQYHEDSLLIKGRGNSTWKSEKKPYEIKLSESYPLCALKSASKWALLANYHDDTKMLNKMTMDLSEDMRMEYYTDSDWIDLYINGDYFGNYLICHEPDIGNGELNIGDLTSLNERFMVGTDVAETEETKGYNYSIGDLSLPSGGYLIEKNLYNRYTEKACGFRSVENYFVVKSPDNASIDEVNYIHDFVNGVDETIHNGASEQLTLVDMYSFARQYLIAEIALNPDAGFTSYYFYKKPGDEKLYAGPCWDFDMAYGRRGEPIFKDYTSSIFYGQQYISMVDGYTALDWDRKLMDNSDYRGYVSQVFCKYLPVYDRLLSNRIDDYYKKIFYSLCMDRIRWEGYEGYEEGLDNGIKYLKFFLFNRLNYLSDVYGGNISTQEPEIYDGTTHLLTFVYKDGHMEKMTVNDGAQIKQDELPEYDHSLYKGWKSGEYLLSYYDPIFEDRTLVLDDYGE